MEEKRIAFDSAVDTPGLAVLRDLLDKKEIHNQFLYECACIFDRLLKNDPDEKELMSAFFGKFFAMRENEEKIKALQKLLDTDETMTFLVNKMFEEGKYGWEKHRESESMENDKNE